MGRTREYESGAARVAAFRARRRASAAEQVPLEMPGISKTCNEIKNSQAEPKYAHSSLRVLESLVSEWEIEVDKWSTAYKSTEDGQRGVYKLHQLKGAVRHLKLFLKE